MSGLLSRIVCDDLRLRAYTVTTGGLIDEWSVRHQASPNALIAFSRALSAAALLGATLKHDSDQTLSLKFSGDGPLREINVQVDGRGNLRGYVANPQVDKGPDIYDMSFPELIGSGILTIMKDLNLKEPYYSTMPLIPAEIAQNIAQYLAFSEQIPSAVIIASRPALQGAMAAGGILIQTMPETTDATIEKIETNINSLNHSLSDALQRGDDIFSYLTEITGDTRMRVLGQSELRLACRCSKEFLGSLIKGFDAAELDEMIERDRGAEVTCAFCRTAYRFNEDELALLRAR